MAMKHSAANAFEPVTFLWVAVAIMFKLLVSSQFRKELTGLKTGMSNLKLLRYCSKKVARELPLITPLFVVVPSIFFGIAFSSYEVALYVAALTLFTLSVIPIVFPMPSTLSIVNEATE